MRKRLSLLRNYTGTLVILAIAAAAVAYWSGSREYDDTGAMVGIPRIGTIEERSILADGDLASKLEPSYYAYLEDRQARGVRDAEGVDLRIPGDGYSAVSSAGAAVQHDVGGRPGPALALTEEGAWVEYEVELPEEGFYWMEMTYYALPGKRGAVSRSVQIDGSYQFFQMKKFEFSRMWREVGDIRHDNQGNELFRPQEEVGGWQTAAFRESQARVYEPVRFHFAKGKHKVRLNMLREPAAIAELRIFSPERPPTYEEAQKAYARKGYSAASGVSIKLQAERASRKSVPSLRPIPDRDPGSEPFDPNSERLNTIGGQGWHRGGQWIEWTFEVPESGLYEIGTRFGTWFISGTPAERIVTIDGKLPFREMNAAKFAFVRGWLFEPLGLDAQGRPYRFYLEKGRHTIRMETQMGGLGKVMDSLEQASRKLGYLNREVIHITGTNPDKNRDWSLEDKIPNLAARMQLIAWQLQDAADALYAFGVRKGSADMTMISTARDEIAGLSSRPNDIPAKLASLKEHQAALGNWIHTVGKQAVQLDYLVVKSPEMPWPDGDSSWGKRALYTANDFLNSFVKDYNAIGSVYDEQDTIEVWVARGRDWVQVIKQMIDEEFTPQTGIRVNVNLMPSASAKDVLLLAATSGVAPDAALGVEADVPVDFAVRNGLVDLSRFPDYPEVAQRFRPGALIPYRFQGGNFALPETQNFYMLFYRKDILEELGVTEDRIPQTWEEVMELIPELQQKGMDFYYPHGKSGESSVTAINEFSPFLFQLGGSYYKDDGSRSNLDSPEALEAFKLWTGLYTNYKIAQDADFYNRFRSGESPIGVSDYTTYLQLSTAAPELTGWWGMKPMPGIRKPDGTIDRSTGGLGQTAIMFKSGKKQEKTWEFMKWWTSSDVQLAFGQQLEVLVGVEARWNTANVEAMLSLPWRQEDLEAIKEQWNWFKEREIVVGGYYTNRHVNNIWNDIVLNGKIIREAIDDGVREIDKELEKKRREFGLDTREQRSAGQ